VGGTHSLGGGRRRIGCVRGWVEVRSGPVFENSIFNFIFQTLFFFVCGRMETVKPLDNQDNNNMRF
jgi:hypothetical protein